MTVIYKKGTFSRRYELFFLDVNHRKRKAARIIHKRDPGKQPYLSDSVEHRKETATALAYKI